MLRVLKLGALCVVVLGIAVLGYEVLHWTQHVYDANARVRTELTQMSSRVDGTVGRIEVREGDRVKAGQLLIVLEARDIELRIRALMSELKLEEARRTRLNSEKAAFTLELESRLATKRKEIESKRIEFRAARDRLQLAKRDLDRVRVLYQKTLTSERELAVEQDKVLSLQGEHDRAGTAVEIAQRELDQVETTRKRLDIFDDQIKISWLTTERIQTNLQSEQVALEFRHIRSPIDAIIDRVYKHKGEYVEEGERILVLHDESLLWLEASIDENEVRHVVVGQPVRIHLQSRPYEEYAGQVSQIGSATLEELGISQGTGRQFGRPAERVPIHVRLRTPIKELVPGMKASINIRIGASADGNGARFDSIFRSLFDLLRERVEPKAGE